jgi:predicted porin
MVRLWAFLTVIALLSACQPEGMNVQPKDIEGTWNVAEAKRNGKSTQTLSRAYYHFSDNMEVETNFAGSVTEATYTLEDNILVQRGQEVIRYTISDWKDSSFVMNFTIQDFNFEFLLKRDTLN